MSLTSRTDRLLPLVLWGMAVHTAAVGTGLLLHPQTLLDLLGFDALAQPFFIMQGGVFHWLMGAAYGTAARAPRRHRALIEFAILVKSVAAVFLITYWLVARDPWSVLASGVVDGAMALVLWLLWRRVAGAAEEGR